MSFLQTFERWHKTGIGHTVMGLLELVIAYGIGSRALDTGSKWEYLFMFIFLFGALQNFTKLVGKLFRVGHKTKTT